MSKRTVVPSPPEREDALDELQYDHPGLNAWRRSGDASALMDPSFAEWEWTVYRLHTPDETVRLRPATPRLWLGRAVGPLDLQSVQSNYGGGTFEFWGKYDGDLRARIRQDLAGPRKDFNAPAPAAAAPAAASTTDPVVLRMLEAQQRTLDALTQRVTAVAPAAAAPFALRDVFELVDRMQSNRPSPGEGQLAEIVTAFKEGISMRDAIGGAPERDKLDIILERVLPVVERVGGQVVAAAQRRAVRPAPRPASTATVVDGAPPPAEPEPLEPVTVVDPGDHRMRTAVEVVANALANGEDPIDTADVVMTILQPSEAFILRSMPDAQVVATLRQNAGGAFPVLERPEAEPFIAAVLAEIRQPSEAPIG